MNNSICCRFVDIAADLHVVLPARRKDLDFAPPPLQVLEDWSAFSRQETERKQAILDAETGTRAR
jgi:hypothetical protein